MGELLRNPRGRHQPPGPLIGLRVPLVEDKPDIAIPNRSGRMGRCVGWTRVDWSAVLSVPLLLNFIES